MVGSTVFYTALLLAIFVVYVFDGPRATRIAISTVAGVSIMVPIIALVLHFQMEITGHPRLGFVPMPNLRINAASVVATVADLVFLGVAWEFLGKTKLISQLWLRSFLTLLGVMWLDVLLFATAAFAGTPGYRNIMMGTLLSRLVICAFASPILFLYLRWRNGIRGEPFETRPVLAILTEIVEIRAELTLAQEEIVRRKTAEAEKEQLIRTLEQTLVRVRKLEGLLPVCSSCRRVRVDSQKPGEPDSWLPLEEYMHKKASVRFTHGICMDCLHKSDPVIAKAMIEEKRKSRS
jgi:uncharacterized PurR-regulated membrane protein YhhQ (DUF165 family)